MMHPRKAFWAAYEEYMAESYAAGRMLSDCAAVQAARFCKLWLWLEGTL